MVIGSNTRGNTPGVPPSPTPGFERDPDNFNVWVHVKSGTRVLVHKTFEPGGIRCVLSDGTHFDSLVEVRDFLESKRTPINKEAEWIVQVKGKRCSNDFEISVVRKNNKHGRASYGWFDEDKLLVTHDGSCEAPLTEKIWDKMIALAQEVAKELNEEESNDNP